MQWRTSKTSVVPHTYFTPIAFSKRFSDEILLFLLDEMSTNLEIVSDSYERYKDTEH